MSSVIEYIRNLAPVYERRELLNSLNQLQDEHNDTLAPLVGDLREAFSGFKFKGEFYGRFDNALRHTVNFNKSAMELLLDSLEQLHKNYGFLEKEVKRLFSIQFSSTNLTYDRVSLMRYIESAFFYVRFARKLLLTIVGEESTLVGSGTPLGWTTAEREYLLDNMSNFAGLLPSINLPESELRATMSRTSNAEVSEQTHELAVRTLGAAKLDPLRVSNFSPTKNPIFSLGKAWAEMQAKRYQAAKDEHLALQLRLQELRELVSGGNASPKLQALIKRHEERVEKLDFYISKIEEENRYD